MTRLGPVRLNKVALFSTPLFRSNRLNLFPNSGKKASPFPAKLGGKGDTFFPELGKAYGRFLCN
jgi:hypothetical protein